MYQQQTAKPKPKPTPIAAQAVDDQKMNFKNTKYKKPNEELTIENKSKHDSVKLMVKEKAKPKEEFSESSFNSSLKYLNEISKKQKNHKDSHRKSKKERREARKLQKKQQKQMHRSRKHIIRPQTTTPPQPLRNTPPK